MNYNHRGSISLDYMFHQRVPKGRANLPIECEEE